MNTCRKCGGKTVLKKSKLTQKKWSRILRRSQSYYFSEYWKCVDCPLLYMKNDTRVELANIPNAGRERGRRVSVREKRGTTTTSHNNRDYPKYLKSSHWKSVRERILKKRKHCEICRSKEKLHVHHRHYKNIGKEPNKDLVLLCSYHHDELHRRSKQDKLTYDIALLRCIGPEHKPSKRVRDIRKHPNSLLRQNKKHKIRTENVQERERVANEKRMVWRKEHDLPEK